LPLSDPGLYDYLPITDRPRLVWPGGARIAVWVAPNVEFYELLPPENPARRAWPRGQPDVAAYSYRDYGNRVGIWRILDVLGAHGVRGSAALNVALCEHHPEIVEACRAAGWEFFSHGVYNTRYLFGLTEAEERAVIEDAIATVLRHTGQRLAGWLSPALSNTERTVGLIAEHGIRYVCDLFHDDQPFPVTVPRGRLISVPYALETNDGSVYGRRLASPREYGDILRAQFDQLYLEGAESGRVMCIPLHPFQSGRPHRIDPLDRALAHIKAHPDVWLATGSEIADWYYATQYDAVVAQVAAQREGTGRGTAS
jgi:peptidoglycan/xylan/chitin deacetylase (PgdA/CDA1 family)